MNKNYFLILLSCFYFFSVKAQDKAYEKLLKDLDVLVPAQMKEWNVAGVAIGVVHKDKLVYAKGFGFRDMEKKLPVTPETFFLIGSNTKAFTATTIGILSDKHDKNYLDTPVHKILPQLQFANEFTNYNITPRDMMSHRTGLPRGDWFNYGAAFFTDSFYMRISNVTPQASFRTQYIYNNYMFLALGRLAEKLSNKKWEENVRELIFDPLGMTQSGTNSIDWSKNENRSKSYSGRKDSIVPVMSDAPVFPSMSSGSILSNLPELTKWVSTWIHGGRYNGKQIISLPYYQQAISAHTNILPSYDPANPEIQLKSYGLGLDLMSYRGHYLVYHGGRFNGFTTNVSFMPQDSIGVIVLINQNSSPLYFNLMYSIYDRLLKLQPVDWNNREREKRRKESETNKKTIIQDSLDKIPGTKSLDLAEYTGSYFHPGIGHIRIILDNGMLVGQLNRGARIRLEHYHYNVFTSVRTDEAIASIKYLFELNQKGKIHKVSFVDPGSNMEFVFNKQ